MTQRPVPPLNARWCRRLAVLCLVSGALFLLGNAILWLVPDWAPMAAREIADLHCEPITLTPTVRLIGLACSSLYLAVLVRALWVARSVFTRFAEGLVFEPQTGVLLRRVGLALVVFAALTPFVRALIVVLVTIGNAQGERVFTFGISDDEIVLAIFGALILTTGSVLAEAARMAEENRQIV